MASSNMVNAQSASLSNIVVEGNKRIASSTILNIANLEKGKTYSAGDINQALVLLKASTYFKSITLSSDNDTVTIKLIENPTLNSINFEGNVFFKDESLLELISVSERQTISPSKIERDVEAIAKAYSATGRISAQVIPKIVERSENRVDLIFVINEGRITEIEKISFIGNRTFSDTRLKAVIATKQAGLFRYFKKSDTLINDRLDFDKQLLQNFYINRGFIDFNVLSTSSALTRNKDAFLLNFSVIEGQQYRFGKVKFIIAELDVDLNILNKLNKIKEGSIYDPRKLDKLIKEVDYYLSKKGINFVTPEAKIIRNDENLLIDIELNLVRSQRVFVERIEVEGNSTTLDEVIRLKFDFVEGDPFNQYKVQEAIDRIRGLGFFNKVDVKTLQGSTSEKIIIEVTVEEKATGSLGIGAGYNSSDGSVFTFNINERNFLGKGQTVDLSVSTSSFEKQFTLGLEDPTFLGRNLLAGVSLGQKTSTPYSVPLTIDNSFISPKFGFPLSRDSRLIFTYRLDEDKTKLSSGSIASSPLIKSDVGNRTKSGIILSYNLDKTNSVVSPNAGYNIELNQEINGLGGDVEFTKTSFEIKSYTTLFTDDIIISSDLSSGAIFGSDANVIDRYSLGGDKLRGFRNYGIGPVDNSFSGSDENGDPLGGEMFAAANIQASFPIGIPEEYGVFGGIFIGAGSVWGLDSVLSGSNIIDDSAKIRSAVGVSLFWDTLIGPLRFNFSRPILKEKYDIIENFRFTVDTRF
ncbi:outer membrane protein assembly factor BamA [Amylibacter sp.]|nr:outer membrane protein assembly factor BamA [Amylibacter sp.]